MSRAILTSIAETQDFSFTARKQAFEARSVLRVREYREIAVDNAVGKKDKSPNKKQAVTSNSLLSVIFLRAIRAMSVKCRRTSSHTAII